MKNIYTFRDNGKNFIVVTENEKITKIDEVDFKVMNAITDDIKEKALRWIYG